MLTYCVLAGSIDKPQPAFGKLKKVFGKDQSGVCQISCDLREAKLQYRDLILTVGLPKGNSVDLRTWIGVTVVAYMA